MVSILWSQLKSMFIKDQLIRKRHYIATLFELFLPILLVLIHVWTIYKKSDQQPPVSVTNKLQSTVYPLNGIFNNTFQCYSFNQSIFYYSPDSVASQLLTPDYRTCGLQTRSLNSSEAVIRSWGDSLTMTSYSANTGLFFDFLDLEEGISNYSVSGGAIDYSNPWGEPVYSTFDNYLRTQSIVNILLANHPNEQKLTSKDFAYFYTTKLFAEGNPSTDQLTNKKETYKRFGQGSGSRSVPTEVLDFYQSYTILEIGFLYMTTLIVRRVVREKSTNSKELLRIMGLTDLIYWLSHFINYFTLSIFHGTIITIIYSIIVKKSPYHGWNPSLFWFNYVMNSVTSILFSFAFTTILTRPVIGVLIVTVGRAALSYVPYAAKTASFKILWISPKVWASLLPSGQLHYSISDLLYFGRKNGKVLWSDIFASIGDEETLTLWSVYFVMIFSWLFYVVLIWYIDAVWPWQTGTPKPWHFPISQFLNSPTVGIEPNSKSNYEEDDERHNEPEPENLKKSIRCDNLYKSFNSSGSKFAVDRLNINILKGQITVLLGHNGAGKTTTMSMITGILKPSSGNIYVNGIDVHKNTVAARRCLALCPQHDLLFEDLTVRENLELCGGLRGLSDQIKKEIIPLNIKRANLTEKANSLASNLSGGMRRRLQLALALSTASEILILDEPTSGLDPESRRQLWDLLLELRKDLTILLTTHFMEEADALGDRIIIMGSGKVKCSGSSMFLKKQFGAGYSVRLAKDAWVYKPTELSSLVQKYFQEAKVTNETNAEIVFQLNNKSNQESTTALVNLCDDLDNNPTSFGITSYGISVTTLEDVFLKVAEDEDVGKRTTITMEEKLFEVNKILDYQKLTGLSLVMQRFKGLVMKRFNYTKRHYKTIGFTIVLPAIVTVLVFLAARNAMSNVKLAGNDYLEPITMDLKEIYGSNAKAVIRASLAEHSPFIDSYRQIMSESGIQVIEIESSISLDDYFKTSSQNREQFMRENIFGIIEDSSKPRGFAAWLNPKAALSLPLSISAWQNALIRSLGDGKRNQSKVSVTYKSMPNVATLEPKYKAIVARIIFALFSPVAFCLIAVSYFLFPSIESQNKCNLIQKMNGITAPMFWFSHYAFDFTYHIIVAIIIFISIIVVDQFPFVAFSVIASVIILLVLFGLTSIPLFYLLSFLPLTPDRGFSLLTTISLVGTVIGSGLASVFLAFDTVKAIYLIVGDLFPPFAASFGLSKIFGAVKLYKECQEYDACPNGNAIIKDTCCNEYEEYIKYDPFTFEDNGINTEITILMVCAFVYTILLISLDKNLHRLGYWYESIRARLSSDGKSENGVEDEDVVRERDRVKQLIGSNGIRNEALIVDGLTKDFGSFRAVDRITFGVHKAECFGLLGVNGAGKTTTFRMLTGDIMVTSGDGYVGGYSLRKDLLNFQQSISYCPQFDALLDNLTPVESLMLFARIRGMPESKVKDNVNYIIESTDLTSFANTCNQNLSGGNKRKLSLAIASIAKPEVIFLDEPTTGVDPASRRKIWSTLIHLRDTSGSSIVLTSHSMDECEALCSRIGIMARGNFKCLGSSQHLKEKFGLGFTLIIKMTQSNQSVQTNQQSNQQLDKIKRWMVEKFPSSILRDVHQTILHYHITDTSLRWGEMLRCLDEAKRLLPIEDFTLTGTTLEQIFLSFAKQT
ncbi:LOW QUALITY PROTEIN: phospholipid-transporting ATPase ABCA3-like [Panonychus citri]|uniref:LOW QUALITY PROTEIN: phospholipid-transporting ATPase ABCA3-like n=1 Tax=Panonychus citri TaxID=50023 RepID=UPI002307FD2B|nr:LOW QUALITY PROTEIN: phospholipid-transporting ATPase ABCA3-like [Panonychus citri]